MAMAVAGCQPPDPKIEALRQQRRAELQRQRDDAARAATATAAATSWFTADVNSSSCRQSGSPADRIRMLQEAGFNAQTLDKFGGAVEVGYEQGGGSFRYWTYYRSFESCMAALPRSQPVPSKYE
ncbi:hypothetical protein ACFPPF_22010 [Xenophilus aerolatus]|nr:hypothetical protein [Xenophilus aerolatus]